MNGSVAVPAEPEPTPRVQVAVLISGDRLRPVDIEPRLAALIAGRGWTMRAWVAGEPLADSGLRCLANRVCLRSPFIAGEHVDALLPELCVVLADQDGFLRLLVAEQGVDIEVAFTALAGGGAPYLELHAVLLGLLARIGATLTLDLGA